jgi:hypothetical protein
MVLAALLPVASGPSRRSSPGGLCYVTVFTGVALETLPRSASDVIAAAWKRRIPMLLRDVIVAARRRLRLPSPPRSVYSVASCLADAA